MCEICHRTPCASRCPNAPEPTPIHTCFKCKRVILPGDDAWEFMGEVFCEYCVDDARFEVTWQEDYI